MANIRNRGLPRRVLGLLGLANDSRPAGETRQQHRQLLDLRDAMEAMLAAQRTERDLLRIFCDLTLKYQIAQLACIVAPSPEGVFQSLATCGPEVVLADARYSIHENRPEGQTPLGLAWREFRPFYSSVLMVAPALRPWSERLERFGLRSVAVLPLQRARKPWALLVLFRREEGSWAVDVQMLLEAVARLLEEALENYDAAHLQSLLGAALKQAYESVVLTDRNRKMLYVNQSFTLMTGYRMEDIAHQGLSVLQGPQTSVEELAAMDHALRQGQPYEGKLINYRRNGEVFWNHLSIIPIRDPSGALTHYVGIQRDESRERELIEQLEYESRHDRLTGLANRRALDDRIESAMRRAQINRDQMAFCMIDLDDFKPINDRFGHEAGDYVLQAVGRRLREGLRRTDYIARVGGDEFVLLVEGYRSLEELELVLTKVEAVVNGPIALRNGREVSVSLSMGVCCYPYEGVRDMGTLFRFADQALYRSKANRENRPRYWIFHGEDQISEARMASWSRYPWSPGEDDDD